MRIRTALVGLGCSLTLIIAGCSATIPGVPQGAGSAPGVVNTGGSGGSGSGTGGGSAPSTPGGSGQTGGSGGSDGGGTGGGSGSTDLPNLSDLPTDLTDLSGLTDLTQLGNIPGLSGDCMAIVNAMIAIGTLFLAPTLGGASLTQAQVDQAFKGLDSAPADIQPAIKTLHDAASQAVGKSSTEALTILGSDAVSKAFDDLSKYSDQHCGGG